VNTGYLGAEFEATPSGFYRLKTIFGPTEYARELVGPLVRPDIAVKEGDYLIAIDGKEVRSPANPLAFLQVTRGQKVSVTINDKPGTAGARTYIVEPVVSEYDLRYQRWIADNIEKIAEASGGEIGYMHITAMGSDNTAQFDKYWRAFKYKKGLIVDVRGNGGGNVSSQIIERLRREVAMIDIARNTSYNPDPDGTIVGPKVMLLDEFSASDGDIVAYRFKKHKIGPVIGKRSWGGVVGIRGSLPLLDGGYLNKPEYSRYDAEGKEWIMEGKGVEPDIFVDNDPAREFAGEDQQLDKAIEVVLELLKAKPPVVPPPPPYPDKSR
jgi:tricorn protease